MRKKILKAALLSGVVAMLCATAAQADGTICSKEYRDSTPAERARMTAILDIVKRSLPTAPAGWRIGGDETVSIISSVCPDDEAEPWRYGFTRTYNRVDDREARDEKFREASAQANAAYAQKQPRMDAVMKKMEALSARQVALIQKGDVAGAQKLSYDMEKLQTEYQKIADEGPSEAIIAAAGKGYAHDTTMSLSIRINTMSVHKRPGSTNITLPPGALVAQRWVDPGSAEKNDEGHGIVLFGTWRVGPPDQWRASARAGAVPTAAHVITVDFQGDPTRIEPMLAAVDYATLKTAFTK
jgi:hypothetical protein